MKTYELILPFFRQYDFEQTLKTISSTAIKQLGSTKQHCHYTLELEDLQWEEIKNLAYVKPLFASV